MNYQIFGRLVRNTLAEFVIRCYQNCVLYGATYLSGIENLMHDYIDFMSDDHIHPNSLGYSFIAGYINNCLNGTSVDFNGLYFEENLPITNSQQNFTIYSRINNNLINFYHYNSTIEFTERITWNANAPILISQNTPKLFAFHNQYIRIPVEFYCISDEGGIDKYYGGTGFLEFNENGIQIFNHIFSGDGSAWSDITSIRALVISTFNIDVSNNIC